MNAKLALLVLLGGSLSAAVGQPYIIYAARATSTSAEAWDPPFYWIPAGGTPFGLSTGLSSTPGLPTRLGCYYHTVNTLAVCEGFGLVHIQATEPSYGCLRYLIQITVPTANASSDVIMTVSSTNCDIGPPSNPNTPLTQTDAFQAGRSGDRWGSVCYLTCRLGVTQPQIEFNK